ncbi:methyltransferase domain-containing protein [Massilia sp. PWRC2]|uniref:methyltransferase domain-containing protein n=1 Tax=Massilia sp. PWRC2 TaxID=2804626 RepID=UPI003CEA4D09
MLEATDKESCYLGQFIPVHYHHNMLMDKNRMQGFKAAIAQAVLPGMTVLELGGGTGVLSWFAAQQASKVYCVEFNPDLVAEARRLLARNRGGEKVELIEADAFDYLPPERVDVVICEMIHVALVREKQVQMMASFKARYLARFGAPLPAFMPEAVVMAIQPLQQDSDFEGFDAPIIQFQQNQVIHADTLELAAPAVYAIVDFNEPTLEQIVWQGTIAITTDGTVNAMRFITKNILAVVANEARTIDWLNNYMTVPLEPLAVRAGQVLAVRLAYKAGCSIPALQAGLQLGLASNACATSAAA